MQDMDICKYLPCGFLYFILIDPIWEAPAALVSWISVRNEQVAQLLSSNHMLKFETMTLRRDVRLMIV